ncbi:MAG: hypothetical protein PHV30_09120 [Candidatus Margulisbacteria bacterium]|nr:hypothetical protein [Candidatus Margulisiibacteriota bacterium]
MSLDIAPIPDYFLRNNQVISLNDIMDSLGMQYIDMTFRFSLLFLGLELMAIWMCQDSAFDRLPLWSDMQGKGKRIMKLKLFKTVTYICAIPAFFLPLIVVLYKYGVRI